MPDPLFEGLYREANKLHWPTVDEVRRRGDQAQQRRRVMVAAVTALMVLAGGALAGRALGGDPSAPPAATAPPAVTSPSPSAPASPGPTESPSDPESSDPSTEPSPSEPGPGDPATQPPETPPAGEILSASAMLQVADLPAGSWVREDSADGDWSFGFSASQCAQSLSVPVEPIDRQEQAYLDGERRVLQRVDRYAGGGDAGSYLEYVRAQARDCGGFTDGSEGLAIVDQGFAGADSLLVRATYQGGYEAFHVFVRQGDLVTEVWVKPTPDAAEAIRLAQRAADRLCNATVC